MISYEARFLCLLIDETEIILTNDSRADYAIVGISRKFLIDVLRDTKKAVQSQYERLMRGRPSGGLK